MGVGGSAAGERAERSDWARRLNLSEGEHDALLEIAARHDRSVAYIIRQAVQVYIAKRAKR